ncbi:DUF5671 domain-containing protein [Candidatus Pacebacteria bacterium]|nr:DUF5671 domain-containing protein [Candidatus Paceibacterota bacterium]
MQHTTDNNDSKKRTISPKDFFLYISATLFLFLSAISFLQFLFAVINISFPEINEYTQGNYGMLRFSLSLLIVSFPLLIYFTRKVNKYLNKKESERENIIRKWLIYLTLFITTVTSVVTLVVLLNFFLDGSLSTRFGLKVLSVLVVVGIVFWFYKKDLAGAWWTNPKKSKQVGYVVSLIILISVVSGFFLIGSPAEQRKIKNDEIRVNNLRSIQYSVLEYWQKTEGLPENLEDLNDPLSYYIEENDPVTGESYEYKVIDELTFELCADFESESLSSSEGSSLARPVYEKGLIGDENWKHEIGKTCFERTINPEIYKTR